MIEIKRIDTEEVIHSLDADNLAVADFRGLNLEKADFRGAMLCGAMFHNANLRGADFTNAELRDIEAWNGDFRDARFDNAELYHASFDRADLRNASFQNVSARRAWFTNTKMEEVSLINADIHGSYFEGSSLVKANLLGAFIGDAELNEADLSQANLFSAHFDGTQLNRTNFSNATFGNNIFFGCFDLHKAIGLDLAIHQGPSAIDAETIRANFGFLPEVFLRGFGFSDEEIRYHRSFYASNPIEFYSCFISYSRADAKFARRLYDTLQGKGIRCWLDEKDIFPGDDIHAEIDKAVKLWDKVLLCASKSSLTSWWCDGEISKAFDKEVKLMKQRGKKVLAVIPLNLDDYIFDPDCTNPKVTEITTRLVADFTNWDKDNDKFDAQLERIVVALRADERARQTPPIPRI